MSLAWRPSDFSFAGSLCGLMGNSFFLLPFRPLASRWSFSFSFSFSFFLLIGSPKQAPQRIWSSATTRAGALKAIVRPGAGGARVRVGAAFEADLVALDRGHPATARRSIFGRTDGAGAAGRAWRRRAERRRGQRRRAHGLAAATARVAERDRATRAPHAIGLAHARVAANVGAVGVGSALRTVG